MKRWWHEYGNCHIKAWGQFVCRGGYLILRRSPYAKFARWQPEWWYRPIAIVGALLQHVGSWVTFVGWVLRWRGFYHASWAIELDGTWWEWVPVEDRHDVSMPSLIFRGRWQEVDAKEERDYRDLHRR